MNHKDDPRLSAEQNQLVRTLAEQGDDSDTFTEAEKLALVAANMMAPEAVGLTSAEEAQLQILPPALKELKLGKGLRLECWVVPAEIRAEWAYTDTKIILSPAEKANWIEEWLVKNRNTFLVQARLHCGNGHMEFEQLYKDEVLGLAAMLKIASERLEYLYLNQPGNKTINEKDTNEQTKPAKQME